MHVSENTSEGMFHGKFTDSEMGFQLQTEWISILTPLRWTALNKKFLNLSDSFICK